MRLWIKANLERVRARPLRLLVRGAAVRAWPVSTLVHRYFRARFSADRWHMLNRKARALKAQDRSRVTSPQRRALWDLREHGIHQTTVAEFLPANFDFQCLQQNVQTLLQRRDIRQQMEKRHSVQGGKWYVVRLLGRNGRVTCIPASLAKLLLNDDIVTAASHYLGLYSRLIYVDVWRNIPCQQSEPTIPSERWHRDHEDVRLLKLFIYLSDVNESAGPLEYLRGTQPGGDYGSLFPSDPPNGSYPRERQLEASVPAERAHRCVGKAGTLILYDACGFHRGGRSMTTPRDVVVATYASDAAIDVQRYGLAEPSMYQGLSFAAKYAIRAPESAWQPGRTPEITLVNCPPGA